MNRRLLASLGVCLFLFLFVSDTFAVGVVPAAIQTLLDDGAAIWTAVAVVIGSVIAGRIGYRYVKRIMGA